MRTLDQILREDYNGLNDDEVSNAYLNFLESIHEETLENLPAGLEAQFDMESVDFKEGCNNWADGEYSWHRFKDTEENEELYYSPSDYKSAQWEFESQEEAS